jgi:hypothetical protein
MVSSLAPSWDGGNAMNKVQNALIHLRNIFVQDPNIDAVAIRWRGQRVLAVMPWSTYAAMMETIPGGIPRTTAMRQSVKEVEVSEQILTDDLYGYDILG